MQPGSKSGFTSKKRFFLSVIHDKGFTEHREREREKEAVRKSSWKKVKAGNKNG